MMGMTPEMTLNRVVFPDPLGPIDSEDLPFAHLEIQFVQCPETTKILDHMDAF